MQNEGAGATDYVYHDYAQSDPPHQPLYLETATGWLREIGARRVLDAGCGDGNFTASLAERGFKMFGVDLSQGGITGATTRYPNIRFKKASVYEDLLAPFPGEAPFDAIVSVEVIEHLYQPRIFVRRISEALVSDGHVIVTTPYWGYLKNVALAVTDRIDYALTSLWDGGHIKHWSFRTLSTLFQEQGFTFVHFAGAGRPIPFLWNGMALMFRKTG